MVPEQDTTAHGSGQRRGRAARTCGTATGVVRVVYGVVTTPRGA